MSQKLSLYLPPSFFLFFFLFYKLLKILSVRGVLPHINIVQNSYDGAYHKCVCKGIIHYLVVVDLTMAAFVQLFDFPVVHLAAAALVVDNHCFHHQR